MGSGLVRAVGPQVAMFLCHERGPSLILFQNALESAAVQIRMSWVDQDILRICMVLLYIYILFFHDQSAVNHNRPLHQITFVWTLRHA